MYRQLIRPLLFRGDPERVHAATLFLLGWAGDSAAGRLLLRAIRGRVPAQPVHCFGLTFANRLGVAAGYDKDVRAVRGLGSLGFGHVEVGTLTPQPQRGNPRPRIFRLPEDDALINRLGFPNQGVAVAVPRLQGLMGHVDRPIVGVSLGKQKDTALDDAAADYLAVMRQAYPVADYIVVNVSSPNTPGLRRLQGRAYLDALLGALSAERQALARRTATARLRPLLLKIAPDLTFTEIDTIVAAALDHGFDGIVAANTTVARDGLHGRHRAEKGGLSGAPLLPRTVEIVRHIHGTTDGRLPIIGVGGVGTAADVARLLDAGATLVQLYTALVYAGPALPGQILRRLAERGGEDRGGG